MPEHVGVIDNCESITDIHDKSEISATSLILTLLAAAANLLPLPRQVMCCSRNSGLVTVVLALAFASADLGLENRDRETLVLHSLFQRGRGTAEGSPTVYCHLIL